MLKVPTRTQYKKHLKEYAQYATSAEWVNWCASIAELRAKRIITLLQDYKDSNAKVLDLGCGIGLTMSLLAQEYKHCIGCDISKKSVVATKDLLKIVGIRRTVIQYDGKRMKLPARSFDAVLSLEVIEHAQDPQSMLAEIARVLKKDGVLIITTANKWWPIEPHFKLLFLSYLPSAVADFYVRATKKGSSYESIKLPSYSQFRKMVEEYFEVEDVTIKILREYQRFALDKERGFKVVVVGAILNFITRFEGTILSFIPTAFHWLILRVSLGWVFIGKPKK